MKRLKPARNFLQFFVRDPYFFKFDSKLLRYCTTTLPNLKKEFKHCLLGDFRPRLVITNLNELSNNQISHETVQNFRISQPTFKAFSTLSALSSRLSSENTYKEERWVLRPGLILSAIFGLGTSVASCSLEKTSSSTELNIESPLQIEKKTETAMHESNAKKLPDGFLIELNRLVIDSERIIDDLEERENHGKPWNSYHKLDSIPDVVVYPKSAEEVSAIVQLCNRHEVPIVAFGGGTSLEGHTMTPQGGLSLDMALMKSVIVLHEEDMDVVVQPGIGWMELNAILQTHGLFFPLDPGPGASIGGMCATRCSGSLAVRYGTMKDNVISMQIVLADGRIVRTSSRARKSAAGLDLTRLMVGSEGTLGIITEVTLKVQRIPEFSIVATCHFPSIKEAADAAIDIMHSGVQPSRVELLDEVMMKAINIANGYSYPERPTMMFELIGRSERDVDEQLQQVKEMAGRRGSSRFLHASTEEEKKELWRARKEALWAGYSLKPGSEPYITDVCVPLSRLAECISETKKELDASFLPCPILSHAGDGNFHVCIYLDMNDPKDLIEAQRLASAMTYRAIAMDGTCTGEHGVGLGKRHFLEKELGRNAVLAMADIKKALDPKNILNPGKIIPPHLCS